MLKFASFATIEARMAKSQRRMMKDAHREVFEYDPQPGMLYVRSRAISSRTNDNFDTFPAEEIAKAYRTFIGKPVFVNHHNEDHRRARGVIVDARLHEDVNPDGTPDVWVEVLMEIDAVRFPKLAEAIINGDIERTSMGTDVEFSVCSFCGNKAVSPLDYCQHVKRMKGQRIERRNPDGTKEWVLVSEICYGLGFFENSLLVEDPADPTAVAFGVELGDDLIAAGRKTASKVAALHDLDRVRMSDLKVGDRVLVQKGPDTLPQIAVVLERNSFRSPGASRPDGIHLTLDIDGVPTTRDVFRDETIERVRTASKTASPGSPGFVDPASWETLQARVRTKVQNAPIPTPADIERNRRSMAESGRPGGDFRGNSYDRRRRVQRLLDEFGDGLTAGCAYCGRVLDANTVEADKIITGALGGRYIYANLLPACRDCNASRSDNPFRLSSVAAVNYKRGDMVAWSSGGSWRVGTVSRASGGTAVSAKEFGQSQSTPLDGLEHVSVPNHLFTDASRAEMAASYPGPFPSKVAAAEWAVQFTRAHRNDDPADWEEYLRSLDPGLRRYVERQVNSPANDVERMHGENLRARFAATPTLYHASSYENRIDIERNGIDHRRGLSPWAISHGTSVAPGNYVWTTLEDAQIYVEGHEGMYDIWAIRPSGLEMALDPLAIDGRPAYRIVSPIPPSHVSLVRSSHTREIPEHARSYFEEQAARPVAASANPFRVTVRRTAMAALCADCGVDVYGLSEYDYMLTDATWSQLGLPSGFLCIGCAEKRLGRTLRRSDFNGAPVNTGIAGVTRIHVNHSDRLKQRLTAAKTASGLASVAAMSGSLWSTSTGVIHRSLQCPTVRRTSEHLRPTPVEDVSEAAIVARYGTRACTLCWPSAPSRRSVMSARTPAPRLDFAWRQVEADPHDEGAEGSWVADGPWPEPVGAMEVWVYDHGTLWANERWTVEVDGRPQWDGTEVGFHRKYPSTMTADQVKAAAEAVARDAFEGWWADFDNEDPIPAGLPGLPWHHRGSLDQHFSAMMESMADTTRTSNRSAAGHLAAAYASWAVADALYTLAKEAEGLAASENGSGPLSDEARRLRRAADEYQADGDAEAERAIALGHVPD